ncbi:MAG TPA: M20/M25/M40 family metallo-hydrolase, partial [Bacteroidales bacterium]|nr:M20/M25/M40 family metallo-hydrolase [Bacteroidales bacterium]
STGDSMAAEYIKKELVACGFQPLSGDGFQRFQVTNRLVQGKNNSLELAGMKYVAGTDFMPMGFSGNSILGSEVVFAGYGFSINNDSLKWNDYQGLDVKGKWVMVLRADPESDKTISPFIPFSNDRDKALIAKDMGAAGVLMISGPGFDPEDLFETLSSSDYSIDIPAIRIKREIADVILSKTNTSVAELEKKLNTARKPSGFTTGTMVSAESEIIRERSGTRNVVMVLQGEDELLKDEYIIFGAHFDHLGMGGSGTSSRAVDTIAVHHGADDNASGVGTMLELAEKLAKTKGSHKRSIICIAFSGEEMGLLGSKYFAENPGIDLSKVNVMINLDMIGRLEEENSLQIGGLGTGEGLRDIVLSLADTVLIKHTFMNEGYGPSDHSSFYGKNIPVLFYSTGAHLDYHTPDDTYEKLNYDGMVKISDQIYKIAEKLAKSSDRLQFKESGPKVEVSRTMRRKGVTLGIMPDFAGNVKNGLRADFVTPGKPAALGGMKKGDIITSVNGKQVNNIQDYMFRLNQLKHGQTINVEVLRDDKKVILLIQL